MRARVKLPEAEGDPFETVLGYHLRRLSVAVMADLTAALGPLGLKPAEASILYLIKARAGLTQSEIGKILGIQRANMAPLVAGLMRSGLLERRSVDGRSQALRLTAAGEKLRAAAWAANAAHEERMFGALSGPARDKLIAQLRELWLSTPPPAVPKTAPEGGD
jgi:DNA-binding MarR family transcriptional regulator